MDVSSIKPENYNKGSTAHFILKAICNWDNKITNYSEVPVGIHHYLGSWDAFSCRDDARMGTWRHSEFKWKRNAELQAGGADDNVRPWISGFVKLVGEEQAKVLLQGVGVLTNCTSWTAEQLEFRKIKPQNPKKAKKGKRTKQQLARPHA